VKLLTGRIGQRERDKLVQQFRDGSLRVLLATQLADEGLDVPRLNRVFLTFPGKHDGRIIQQIGRTIRTHDGKEDALVYDFFDPNMSVLAKQYLERRDTYKKLGIPIRKVVHNADEDRSEKKGRRLSFDQLKVGRSRRAG
jgi:superfamily II DNA or RNA helicase